MDLVLNNVQKLIYYNPPPKKKINKIIKSKRYALILIRVSKSLF